MITTYDEHTYLAHLRAELRRVRSRLRGRGSSSRAVCAADRDAVMAAVTATPQTAREIAARLGGRYTECRIREVMRAERVPHVGRPRRYHAAHAQPRDAVDSSWLDLVGLE